MLTRAIINQWFQRSHYSSRATRLNIKRGDDRGIRGTMERVL